MQYNNCGLDFVTRGIVYHCESLFRICDKVTVRGIVSTNVR